MRIHNVKDINLQITNASPFINLYSERESYGLQIDWTSNIGWGSYSIYKVDNVWHADSETMDCNEDKEFITELMRLFIEQLEIKC